MYISYIQINDENHKQIIQAIELRDRENKLPVSTHSEEDTALLEDIYAEMNKSVQHMFQEAPVHDTESITSSLHPSPRVELLQDAYVCILNNIEDPITHFPVSPPPYAMALQVLSQYLATHPELDRLLAYEQLEAIKNIMLYFPRLLHICCTPEGRRMLITLHVLELSTSLTLFGLGLWQVCYVLVI